EGEPVFNGGIAPKAAHIDCVLARCLRRRHIAFIRPMIDDNDAGSFAQRLARGTLIELALELHVDRLGMADEDGNAYARRTDSNIWIQDLPRLDRHLPLFLG